MPFPYDATLKSMFDISPEDWVRFLGFQSKKIAMLDSDLSTVSTSCDKAIRLEDQKLILHLEFQTGPDSDLPDRCDRYNKLLQCDNKTAVESFVFLLRPQADLPNLDGCFTYYSPHRKKPYRHFDYTVIRVWELDPEEILRNGGIGLLPLTAISSITLPEIPQLIRTLHKHWNPAKIGAVALDLWTAFDILLGLRCTKDQVEELMKGITSMEESTTYQAIFHKGELQGVEKGVEKGRVETREILFQATLNAAAQKFQSKPPSPVAKRLKSLEDPSEYVQLIQNLEHAKNWEEWLPPKHSRKRGS